jgi:hypothetical protein
LGFGLGWFFGLGLFLGCVVGGERFLSPCAMLGYVGWDGMRMGRYIVG